VASEERLRELEEKYEGYKVYDNRGEKIGKVDDLFVDESDNEEYIGVKLGLFGMKSTLIPMDIVRVNEEDKAIEVSDTKDHVKDAPTFGDDDEVTTEYENHIRSHFGLESLGATGSYGAHSGAGTASESDSDESTSRSSGTSAEYTDDEEHTDDDPSRVDTEYGGRTDSSTAASEGSDTGYDERSESSSGSSTGGSSAAFGGASTDDRETGGTPTSRQTEETETVEEDGRTKVRRRVVREEIVEEDQDS
jgi:sporulation protein YlmC with PRC-barrel domain